MFGNVILNVWKQRLFRIIVRTASPWCSQNAYTSSPKFAPNFRQPETGSAKPSGPQLNRQTLTSYIIQKTLFAFAITAAPKKNRGASFYWLRKLIISLVASIIILQEGPARNTRRSVLFISKSKVY